MAALDIAEVRAVGRHGAVTLDEAAAAARKLGEFTRAQLAEELGVKPIAVGRFLTLLAERKMVEPDQDERGLFYRCALAPLASEVFLPPEPTPDPLEEPLPLGEAEPAEAEEAEVKRFGRVTAEEVRDWAIMLERFTVYQLAQQMEVSYVTARRHVESLCAQGIVVDSGWKGAHDSVIYELQGDRPENTQLIEAQRKRVPVEQEVLGKFGTILSERRGLEVVTRGCPKVSNHKDVQQLAALAYAAGWSVEERAKHYRIVAPSGTVIGVPSTPSTGGVRRMRDELRRAGLPTLSIGEPNEQLEAPSAHGAAVDNTSRTHKRRQANMNVAGTRRPGRRGQGRKS